MHNFQGLSLLVHQQQKIIMAPRKTNKTTNDEGDTHPAAAVENHDVMKINNDQHGDANGAATFAKNPGGAGVAAVVQNQGGPARNQGGFAGSPASSSGSIQTPPRRNRNITMKSPATNKKAKKTGQQSNVIKYYLCHEGIGIITGNKPNQDCMFMYGAVTDLGLNEDSQLRMNASISGHGMLRDVTVTNGEDRALKNSVDGYPKKVLITVVVDASPTMTFEELNSIIRERAEAVCEVSIVSLMVVMVAVPQIPQKYMCILTVVLFNFLFCCD